MEHLSYEKLKDAIRAMEKEGTQTFLLEKPIRLSELKAYLKEEGIEILTAGYGTVIVVTRTK